MWLAGLGTEEDTSPQAWVESLELSITAPPLPEMSPVFPCEAVSRTYYGHMLIRQGTAFFALFLP